MTTPTSPSRSRSPWITRALIVAGGALGAGIRYLLGQHFAGPVPPDFPWTTFAINLSGAFLIGFVATMLLTSWSGAWYAGPLVVTGLLGGYTTWSHFIVEIDELWSAGQKPMAITYGTASVALGVVCAAVGVILARSIARPTDATEVAR